MSALTHSLGLLLTVAPADEPARVCELTDNACKAEQFVEKSTRAAPALRAVYLFGAYRSYLAVFAKTNAPHDLCAARKNLDRSLAVPGQSDDQLASFEASRVELEALAKKHAIRCATKRRPRPEPSAVAQAVTPPPTPAPTAQVLVTVTAAPATASPAQSEPAATDGLLPVPVARQAHRVSVLQPTAAGPVAAAQSPRPIVTPREHPGTPGRPFVIAGGTSLGLGVILASVSGYAGSQVADASRASYGLYDATHGQGGPDVLAAEADIQRRFGRWMPVTVGTAIAGTTAVIVGAVMLRVGIRRMKQGPARAALLPVPGGLAFSARF